MDQIVAILADFRSTRDWFYAFRWVPQRKVGQVVKAGSATRAQRGIFEAHSRLSPLNNPKLVDLSKEEYKARYMEIVRDIVSSSRS